MKRIENLLCRIADDFGQMAEGLHNLLVLVREREKYDQTIWRIAGEMFDRAKVSQWQIRQAWSQKAKRVPKNAQVPAPPPPATNGERSELR